MSKKPSSRRSVATVAIQQQRLRCNRLPEAIMPSTERWDTNISRPWRLNWIATSACSLLAMTSACTLEPQMQAPKVNVPAQYKEQIAPADLEQKGQWKPAEALEKMHRGSWWKIFNEPQLNELETQAVAANPNLAAAAARVEQARALARANNTTLFPQIDVGANAVRAKPSDASVAAFGVPSSSSLKPYTLYGLQASASYEVDLFGRVRSNERAFLRDADAQAALYQSVLLTLQADVAQQYFSLRAIDAERVLLRDTIKIREEAARIMKRRYEEGVAGGPDYARTQSDLASTQADLLVLDRQRITQEHALAMLLGKLPSEFTFAEAPLMGAPPIIPSGMPSTLLERRPDVSAAANAMAAANARIGVARTAFFPNLILTALGGFESVELGDLLKWSNRTWALGQLAGSALNWTLFDNGRTAARLDVAKAAYEEAVANYRQQTLVAFQEVETNLAAQRLLAEQSAQQDAAASEADHATVLERERYNAGDVDYFQVVETQRTSLALQRAALQTQGQRFLTTITLVRALGGGWEADSPEPITIKAVSAVPASRTETPLPAVPAAELKPQ